MAFPNPPKTWAFQESVESSELNAQLRDALLLVGPHLIVRKPSDESVTSSAVLQNDDHLLLPVAANEIWHWEMFLYWSAGTTGDMAWSFTVPAGATFNATTLHPTAGSGTTPVLAQIVAGGSTKNLETQDTANGYTHFYGLIVNGGTAGNLQFQWAQNTSNGTATIVKANSTLWAVKLA